MSILEHPTAQALLELASVSAAQVRHLATQLHLFLQRYLPCFSRKEQHAQALLVLQGKLSGLQRKTNEPIATQAGVPRKPVQHFVGAGKWHEDAVLTELQADVAQHWGDPDAVRTFDPSGCAKKGSQSCGVARQYCGRLGKVDNCQVGLFAGYACRHGHPLLDCRLFLPKEWTRSRKRRRKTHIPKGVRYRGRWQIALDLLGRCRHLPHRWVTADSELGRVTAFRARLRRQRERYLVEVRADTRVRDLDAHAPKRRGRTGRRRKVPFASVRRWAARQPARRWQRFVVRAGGKGPLTVEVLTARVQTCADNRVGPEERLLVVRSLADGHLWYKLSNAPTSVAWSEWVRAHGEHHRVEECLQDGKGEVGLAQYEVRSWVGWHHPMTLSLLALWFLAWQRQREGGEARR